MTTEQTTPKLSKEQAQALKALGIDPTALASGAIARGSVFENGLQTQTPINMGQQVFNYGPAGGETTPVKTQAGDLIKNLYTLGENEVRDLQMRLLHGGFYDASVTKDDITWGQVDDVTYKAYLAALERTAKYNEAGKDNSLDNVINTGLRAKAASKGNIPSPIVLDNPADIRAGLRKVAPDIIGQELSKEETDRLVNLYTGVQRWAQTASREATKTGGTETQAPSLGAFAEDYIRKNHPDEAYNYSAIEHMNEFFNLLKNG
jgi:hypothetical protein